MSTKQPKKRTLFKKVIIGVGIVFGLFLLIGIIGTIFFPINYYAEGLDAYNKRDYEKALKNLNRVEPEHVNYKDAIAKIQEIKPIVDSVKRVKKEQGITVKNSSTTNDPEFVSSETGSSEESGSLGLKDRIINNIKSIDGGDDFGTDDFSSATEFQLAAAIYAAYASVVNEGKNSVDKDVNKLAKELERKVISSQLRNFPKLRKAYYQFIKNTLWEHDVDVNLSGSGNTTLKFTGAYFASNRNIKTTQESLQDMLSLLRFKQTQFRWYNGQDDYTYYTIESSKDNVLAE